MFVTTLVKILKLTFNRQMGLYFYVFVASLHFGSRIIEPKFRLHKGRSPLWNFLNRVTRSSLTNFEQDW
jgi:hypothetical protein